MADLPKIAQYEQIAKLFACWAPEKLKREKEKAKTKKNSKSNNKNERKNGKINCLSNHKWYVISWIFLYIMEIFDEKVIKNSLDGEKGGPDGFNKDSFHRVVCVACCLSLSLDCVCCVSIQ